MDEKKSASTYGTSVYRYGTNYCTVRVQACSSVTADSGDHGQVQDPHVRGGNQRGQ
jgi:hypothetical protein